MSDSAKKYQDKENYIIPMSVEDREGFLFTQIYEENKELISEKDVLHIGCNHGTSTLLLDRLGPKNIEGIDVNGEAIEMARDLLPHLKFHVASAHDLPFDDDSFDSILLFEVFEHLYEEDKSSAVSEFSRVLRPGGQILLSVPRAVPGSKDQRLRQNAYDPHHVSFYFQEQDVHKDFPEWDCLNLYHETRPNPNNGAHHNSWIATYKNPKEEVKKKQNPSAQIRSGMSYGDSHDY
ncbi:MAG: class I SAM-dependent methyltransferase [Candidatus Thorarchaeota archaeon]|jgi:SAM-dependent methyltransferase